jgi:hypothetical protein
MTGVNCCIQLQPQHGSTAPCTCDQRRHCARRWLKQALEWLNSRQTEMRGGRSSRGSCPESVLTRSRDVFRTSSSTGLRSPFARCVGDRAKARPARTSRGYWMTLQARLPLSDPTVLAQLVFDLPTTRLVSFVIVIPANFGWRLRGPSWPNIDAPSCATIRKLFPAHVGA